MADSNDAEDSSPSQQTTLFPNELSDDELAQHKQLVLQYFAMLALSVNEWYTQQTQQQVYPLTYQVFQNNRLETVEEIPQLVYQPVDDFGHSLAYYMVLDCRFDDLFLLAKIQKLEVNMQIHTIVRTTRLQPEKKHTFSITRPFFKQPIRSHMYQNQHENDGDEDDDVETHIRFLDLIEVMYALFVEKATSKQIRFSESFTSEPELQQPARIFEYILKVLPMERWRPMNVMRLLCLCFNSVEYQRSIANQREHYISRNTVPAVNFELSADEKHRIRWLAVNHFYMDDMNNNNNPQKNNMRLLFEPFRVYPGTLVFLVRRITTIMAIAPSFRWNDAEDANDINRNNLFAWHTPLALSLYQSIPNHEKKEAQRTFDQTVAFPKNVMNVDLFNAIMGQLDVVEYVSYEGYQPLAEIVCVAWDVYETFDQYVELPFLPADILAQVLVTPMMYRDLMFPFQSALLAKIAILQIQELRMIKTGVQVPGFAFPLHSKSLLTEWLMFLQEDLRTNTVSGLYPSVQLSFPENLIQMFSTLCSKLVYDRQNRETPVSHATMLFLSLDIYYSPEMLLELFDYFLQYPVLAELIRNELRYLRVFFRENNDAPDIENTNDWSIAQHTQYMTTHTDSIEFFQDFENVPLFEICMFFESTRVDTIIKQHEIEKQMQDMVMYNSDDDSSETNQQLYIPGLIDNRYISSSSRNKQRKRQVEEEDEAIVHFEFGDPRYVDVVVRDFDTTRTLLRNNDDDGDMVNDTAITGDYMNLFPSQQTRRQRQEEERLDQRYRRENQNQNENMNMDMDMNMKTDSYPQL